LVVAGAGRAEPGRRWTGEPAGPRASAAGRKLTVPAGSGGSIPGARNEGPTDSSEANVIVLLVVIIALTLVATVLMVEMMRRDEPPLGLASLGVLVVTGVAAAVYGMLISV
jgi:hypothetical protein